MRLTAELIEQNNNKREALKKENLALYEDFLLYVRTDLRVDEQAGEEILMDLLDHLLEAQEYGKTAAQVFGNRPINYADELIENLPQEKKRSVALFVLSQILGLAGWFSITYGIIFGLLSLFTEVDSTVSLGNLLTLLGVTIVLTFFGIVIIFKMIRATLFKPKKKKRNAYWQGGFFGVATLGVIFLTIWLVPDFGSDISLEWWVYALSGLLFFTASKAISRSTRD